MIKGIHIYIYWIVFGNACYDCHEKKNHYIYHDDKEEGSPKLYDNLSFEEEHRAVVKRKKTAIEKNIMIQNEKKDGTKKFQKNYFIGK